MCVCVCVVGGWGVGGVRRSHLVVFDFNFTRQKRKGRGGGRKGGAMGWGGVARGDLERSGLSL